VDRRRSFWLSTESPRARCTLKTWRRATSTLGALGGSAPTPASRGSTPSPPASASYPLLPEARADLLARAGQLDEAARHYRAALALVEAPAECAALERRLELGLVAGPLDSR
jgi:hypothetical protein